MNQTNSATISVEVTDVSIVTKPAKNATTKVQKTASNAQMGTCVPETIVSCVKDESGKVLSISNARYFTYGGLCIATAIIFQRSTLIAGALGVFIGVYIPFAEYYLQNMDGELQPFVKQ